MFDIINGMGILKRDELGALNTEFSEEPGQEDPKKALLKGTVLKGVLVDSEHRVTLKDLRKTEKELVSEPDSSSLPKESKEITPEPMPEIEPNLDAYDQDISPIQEVVETGGLPEEELVKIEKEAFQRGYDECKKELNATIEEQAQEIVQELNRIAEERDAVLAQSEEGILNLSIKIAEKLVNAQLSADRSTLKSVLDEAFKKISSSDKVVIKANTKDIDYLRGCTDEFKQQLKGVGSVSVEEDMSLSEGSCVIETDYGFIDARLPMKVSMIEKALKKAYLSGDV